MIVIVMLFSKRKYKSLKFHMNNSSFCKISAPIFYVLPFSKRLKVSKLYTRQVALIRGNTVVRH